MNILMLNYEFPPVGGGAANANHELLKGLAGYKDLHIDLITASPYGFAVEKLSDNIMVHRLDIKKKSLHYWHIGEIAAYFLKALNYSQKLSRGRRYDLWHSFNALPQGLIPFLLGKRYILSLRGSDVPGFNPRLKALAFPQKLVSRLLWQNAKAVIANSQGLKALALKTSKTKIGIIPNGVDTSLFSPGKPGGITLLAVSRLIPRKGLIFLVGAMPNIIKKHRDARLVIAGDGPQKAELEKLAKDLSVSKNIEFLGYVSHDRLPSLYGNAYLFILPSLYEGMSNTVLEAMASGLPIITTDTGGTKELLDSNGIIIRKSSSEDIANAVLELLDNKKKRDAYAKRSREIALSLSWDKVAEEYYEVYKNEIQKTPNKASKA